jgi:hypothetical protein
MNNRRYDALLDNHGERIVEEYLQAKERGMLSPVVTMKCDVDATDPDRVEIRVDERTKAAARLELESPQGAAEVRRGPSAEEPITLVINAGEGCLVIRRALP